MSWAARETSGASEGSKASARSQADSASSSRA
eukprot:CAMPEP_0177745184 /NCGR_PEP_ID=MMETSP0484_2-20121128/30176_1 /TAXON_ID=354590 /ORGANISM="Rhodomonas lens, Strain RHODO" /LENGTH=31 /DNA_ID= /DNA_START= /DNA_END= /DNA_ORIENTATION=